LFFPSTGWENDAKRCDREGGPLASMHSYKQNEYFASYSQGLPGTPGHKDVTIGLREQIIHGKRTWAWTDQTPVNYKNWLKGWPKNATEDTPLRCATLFTDIENSSRNYGKWRHHECDSVQELGLCVVDGQPVKDPNDSSSSEVPSFEEFDVSARRPKRSLIRADRSWAM